MAEAVASHSQFRAPSTFAPAVGADDLRKQVEDFEMLVETMLEQYELAQKENARLKAENKALTEENERLRSK